jgi:hypothetical protein
MPSALAAKLRAISLKGTRVPQVALASGEVPSGGGGVRRLRMDAGLVGKALSR